MKLQEKQMIHGFAVDRSRYVPELHSQAYELHHVRSLRAKPSSRMPLIKLVLPPSKKPATR